MSYRAIPWNVERTLAKTRAQSKSLFTPTSQLGNFQLNVQLNLQWEVFS